MAKNNIDYLLNISSNHNPKFYIGVALTHLNELGDMLVSDIFISPDREQDTPEKKLEKTTEKQQAILQSNKENTTSPTLAPSPYYNCCVLLSSSLGLHALEEKTKETEKLLGRKRGKAEVSIDIDIIGLLEKPTQKQKEKINTDEKANIKNWQILKKRLPLTQDVCWGIADLAIDITQTQEQKYPSPPVKATWQL